MFVENEMINFRGDLIDISAKKEALVWVGGFFAGVDNLAVAGPGSKLDVTDSGQSGPFNNKSNSINTRFPGCEQVVPSRASTTLQVLGPGKTEFNIFVTLWAFSQ